MIDQFAAVSIGGLNLTMNRQHAAEGQLLSHRRTGYFLPGGAVNHLPKKIFASCPNFYKTVEQKRGPMQQHRPHWQMKMAPYSFSGSIPAKFEHKLRRPPGPYAYVCILLTIFVVLHIKHLKD